MSDTFGPHAHLEHPRILSAQRCSGRDEIIKAEAEAFWDRAASGAFLEDACALRSRELQDAMYVRRSANPLLFPFIFTGLRTSMLGRLTIGIAELVKQAGGNN